MKHLTVDEMIEFVSLTELHNETVKLSASVNGHIRKCEKCLKLVRSLQMVYDEFLWLSSGGSFKNYVADKASEIAAGNQNAIEAQSSANEFDGYK